jgi:hypothetical protein
MPPKKPKFDPERQKAFLAGVKRDQAAREKGYRDQALALFPHVCARCGRSFAGKTLRELTVHHRDHNHDNNPPDGSNWELLCLYCHDYEHQNLDASGYGRGTTYQSGQDDSRDSPFAGLGNLLKPGDEEGVREDE